jgi:hypothetical protein
MNEFENKIILKRNADSEASKAESDNLSNKLSGLDLVTIENNGDNIEIYYSNLVASAVVIATGFLNYWEVID